MIWHVTGDLHGNITRFNNYPAEWNNEDHAVIVLGDVGFNFWHDSRDTKLKKKFCKDYNFYLYCVKGNHEDRPSAMDSMTLIYDENVGGEVWYEEAFPTIRFFKEFGRYRINGLSVYVIGGAYSVDKNYRLMRGIGWFANEQLTEEERNKVSTDLSEKHYDLILSHTCPYSWRPTDLFLSFINQSTVDETMEKWLEAERLKDWGIWLFGHYHADRLVRPCVEMYYRDTEHLDTIITRWNYYKEHGELRDCDKLMPKDPNFYL